MKKKLLVKPFKSKLLLAIAVVLLLSFTVPGAFADEEVTEEPPLATELKKEVNKTNDFQLKVFVLTNPESKLQDIYIMTDGENGYCTEPFENAIKNPVDYIKTDKIASK